MKAYFFHREARDEYTAAATYYAGISPELGQRFHLTIEALIQEARQTPNAFRFVSEPVRRT